MQLVILFDGVVHRDRQKETQREQDTQNDALSQTRQHYIHDMSDSNSVAQCLPVPALRLPPVLCYCW